MTDDGKTIVHVDMDFVLVDYQTGYLNYRNKYPNVAFPQSIKGFFLDLKPMPGAIDAWRWLSHHHQTDLYILTAPSVRNPHSYAEKRIWVEEHLGAEATYKLIISPNKGLSKGDFLIDDNVSGKGQETFSGEIIHFGSERFPDWKSVISFFETALKSKSY